MSIFSLGFFGRSGPLRGIGGIVRSRLGADRSPPTATLSGVLTALIVLGPIAAGSARAIGAQLGAASGFGAASSGAVVQLVPRPQVVLASVLGAASGLAGLGAASGMAGMTAALERGDLDEASRLGVLAGPAVVEQGLASPARSTRLAAVAAAPAVEGRSELLPALAAVARSGDRRAAIPAARAARTIARELARREAAGETADDLDLDDVAMWRTELDAIARNPHRFIEVRVLALDTVASLAQLLTPGALGFDLAAALDDADPAYRAIAIANVPRPTPVAAYAPLASTVKNDADDRLALAAAQVLCGDDRAGAVAQLGAQGLDRIKKLVAGTTVKVTRDARQCLAR